MVSLKALAHPIVVSVFADGFVIVALATVDCEDRNDLCFGKVGIAPKGCRTRASKRPGLFEVAFFDFDNAVG